MGKFTVILFRKYIQVVSVLGFRIYHTTSLSQSIQFITGMIKLSSYHDGPRTGRVPAVRLRRGQILSSLGVTKVHKIHCSGLLLPLARSASQFQVEGKIRSIGRNCILAQSSLIAQT
jgi:hypothetical protein